MTGGARKPGRKTAVALAATAAGMLALSFAAVPLYDTFCRITGYGGETRVADAGPERVLDRTVTVRFDANVANDLPWRFEPVERRMTVRLGEPVIGRYRVTNVGGAPSVGIASYNVAPAKAGIHFNKLECFCFLDQRLEPGESAVMPVLFFLDPAMDEARNLDEVAEITLSYTFHRSKNSAGAS